MIAQHLVSASEVDSSRTAILTYNARGVGLSEGGQPWWGVGHDPDDFAAVERWGVETMRPAEVFRLVSGFSRGQVEGQGYSWGCLAAVFAPGEEVVSTLLISPPVSLFRIPLAFQKMSFQAAVEGLPKPRPDLNTRALKDPGVTDRDRVWMVYGTQDNFTSAGTFESFIRQTKIRGVQIEGADHFYMSEQSGTSLEHGLKSWLGTMEKPP